MFKILRDMLELAKIKKSGVELMFKLGGVTTFKKKF